MTADPIEVQMQLTMSRFDEWIKNDLFHMRWWLIALLFTIDIFLWWKIVDKSRLREIILFAAITAAAILIFDEIGEELTFWYYPTDIFPLFPPIEAVDTACLPFLYSLVFQFCTKWKTFTIVMIGLSIFSCFIFEPIFIWLGMYKTITWKTYYGLPLYFAIGMLGKAIVAMIKAVEKKSAGKGISRIEGV